VVAVEQTDHTLVTLSITLAASGNSISGSWEVAFGTCAGASGPFDATKALAQLPHFRVRLGGLGIHFVHVRAAAPAGPVLPLVLSHGWPDSFWRYAKVVPLLTDPGAHGADPADAFDVVVPDMPGYGYSDRPIGPALDSIAVAGLWAKLMSALGYAHFGAAGGDIGSHVSRYIALDHPERVLALFLARRRTITWVALAVAAGAALLSMGPTVHVLGHVSHLDLPDYVLQKLPFFHNLLPDRFASTMTLGVGLLVALGLDELKRLRPPAIAGGLALAGVGLVAIVPTVHYPSSDSALYKAFYTGFSCPLKAPGSSHPPVALVLPVVNELDLRWQAESKFCFAIPSDTGMTGTNGGDVKSQGVLFTVGNPALPMPPMTAAVRAQAAQEIRSLDIKEIVVDPEGPAVPQGTPQEQAQLVAWVGWLLGQAPAQSQDRNISYVWMHLPCANDIASGHVGTFSGRT